MIAVASPETLLTESDLILMEEGSPVHDFTLSLCDALLQWSGHHEATYIHEAKLHPYRAVVTRWITILSH